MNSEKIEVVISKIEARAKSYGNGAAAGFFFVIVILLSLGGIFCFIGFPEPNESNLQFGIKVAFNLTLKLALVVFAFYIIKLQMSVVSYNLSLSNDLYAKSEALSLYSADGKNNIKDLYEFLSVNNHKFQSLKDFSGSEEFNNLVGVINLLKAKPDSSGKIDNTNTPSS